MLGAFPPLLRNRNFLLLWLAYVISALGDRIHFLVMLKLLEPAEAHKLGRPGYEVGAMETVAVKHHDAAAVFAAGADHGGDWRIGLPRRAIMITSDLRGWFWSLWRGCYFCGKARVLCIDGAVYGILLR